MLSSIVAFVYRNDSQKYSRNAYPQFRAVYSHYRSHVAMFSLFNTLRTFIYYARWLFICQKREICHIICAYKRKKTSQIKSKYKFLTKSRWMIFFKLSFLAVSRIWLSFLLLCQWRTNRKDRIHIIQYLITFSFY